MLLVPVHDFIGPKIIATPIAVKHMDTVMVTHMHFKCGKYWQIFKSLVTDITGVKYFPIVFCAFVFDHFLVAVKPQVAVITGRVPFLQYSSFKVL